MANVTISMGYEKGLMANLRNIFSIPMYDFVSVSIISSKTGMPLYGSPLYFGKDKSKGSVVESFSFFVDLDENEQQYEALAELNTHDVNGALNQVINFCNNIRVRSNVSARNLFETELLLITVDEFACLKKSLRDRIKAILAT
jgi:hypothetical protein